MTPEQKQAWYDKKRQLFIDGVRKVEKETGMCAVAVLQSSPRGIIPTLAIVMQSETKEPEASEAEVNG